MSATRTSYHQIFLRFVGLSKAKDRSPEFQALATETLNKMEALAKNEKNVEKLLSEAIALQDEFNRAIEQPPIPAVVEQAPPAPIVAVNKENEDAPRDEYLEQVRDYLERTIDSFNEYVNTAEQDPTLLAFCQESLTTLLQLREAKDAAYVQEVCDFMIEEEDRIVAEISKQKIQPKKEEVLEPKVIEPVKQKEIEPVKQKAIEPVVVAAPLLPAKKTPVAAAPAPQAPLSKPKPADKSSLPKTIVGSILVVVGIAALIGGFAGGVGLLLPGATGILGGLGVFLTVVGLFTLRSGLRQPAANVAINSTGSTQTHQKVVNAMQKQPGKDKQVELAPVVTKVVDTQVVKHEVSKPNILVNAAVQENRRVSMSA